MAEPTTHYGYVCDRAADVLELIDRAIDVLQGLEEEQPALELDRQREKIAQRLSERVKEAERERFQGAADG